ncbi:MAG: response regulator [Sutterella parvirubra]|uniref:response regulator transcription factor n=1 Tax=Sutterella parvirubra TaxID=437898 RepID=UPI001FDF2B8A|nr:response regulator [Sutterella parvirubra]MCI7708608.1 response regulator [Sutterella parvirubra]MDR3770566.1 response regulator [Sutterella sp.]
MKDYRSAPPGCVLLDIRMPGLSGLELQARMKEENLLMPIVFITGHGDVPTAVQAVKNGASTSLRSPSTPSASFPSLKPRARRRTRRKGCSRPWRRSAFSQR